MASGAAAVGTNVNVEPLSQTSILKFANLATNGS